MSNTYLTGNPLGSTAPKDLYDNASNFDEAMNSPSPAFYDRFNKRRETWAGMEAEFDGTIASFETQFSIVLQALGYEAVHLTYVPGSPLQVDRQTQLIDYLGSSYRVKTPADFPVTLTGTWATDSALLLDVGDAALRSDLANSSNPALGAATVARVNQVVTTFAELRALNKTSPSRFVALQGVDFLSFYIRDDADTTSVEVIPTLMVATDGARYKLNHNGVITAEQCGLVGDGVTINTSASVNRANVAVRDAAAEFFWRPRTYVCESIDLIPNQNWKGTPFITRLKAKNGLNQAFISSNFNINTNNVLVQGIVVDGNSAGNTSGVAFALKGAKQQLRQLTIVNAAGTALTTDYDIGEAEAPPGFESIFEDILLFDNKEHGWIYNGPTDSSMVNVTVIDAGTRADNTYIGFWALRNFRAHNIHTWNRSTTTNVPASSVLIDANAPACTATNSHFEGGHTPLKVMASGCVFTASAYYATRGSYCIENYGLANQFQGILGATSYHLNMDYNGVLCSGGNSRFDLSDVGCRTGAIDFTGSQGGNSVLVVGWRATGIPFFGTPAANDDVDLLIGGGGGGSLRQKRKIPMTTLSTSVIAESGTLGNASADLSYLLDGSMVDLHVRVSIVSNGTGAVALQVPLSWVAARTSILNGYADATGSSIRGVVTGGTNILRITSDTGAYVGQNNVNLRVNGRMERV